MRVDFYQLGSVPAETVIASLGNKLLAAGDRLLVVADDPSVLAKLDRLLWDQGASSFLPHAVAGGIDDARQPLLLSTGIDAANGARNLLIADGKWRDAALGFQRAFYLFDEATLQSARAAWRSLGDNQDADCHYWANEDGRWAEKASTGTRTA